MHMLKMRKTREIPKLSPLADLVALYKQEVRIKAESELSSIAWKVSPYALRVLAKTLLLGELLAPYV